MHYPDRHKPKSETSGQYPHVNFDLANEEDSLYEVYTTKGIREPAIDAADRGKAFLKWLGTRPEREVLVVTHSAFLRTLFNHVIPVTETFESFKNAELRSFIITFSELNST